MLIFMNLSQFIKHEHNLKHKYSLYKLSINNMVPSLNKNINS